MLPSSVRFDPMSGKIKLFHPQARSRHGLLAVEVEFTPEDLLDLMSRAHEAVDEAYDHQTRVELAEAASTAPPLPETVRVGIAGR